ncbi:TPA: hypothetical protein PQB14_002918 [Staphylococcus aureus]|nr:hypothetical protein [Staphylococcus aureus]HDJ3619472.1 hypothetical protein [Staphylococcus aureus]
MNKLILMFSIFCLILFASTSFLYNEAEANDDLSNYTSSNQNFSESYDEITPKGLWGSVGKFLASNVAYDAGKWAAKKAYNYNKGKKKKHDYSRMRHTGYACYGVKSASPVSFENTPEFSR